MAHRAQILYYVCLWRLVIAARLRGNMNTEILSGDNGNPCEGFPELQDCTCYDGVVDCQSLEFSVIPPLPPNTTHLIMKNNEFTQVQTLPEYKQLYLLDMSRNHIETIEVGAFKAVPNLKELYLHVNYLDFSRIPPNVFDPLISLKILNIGDNFMWQSIDSYRDDLMENLSTLEDLTMDGLPTPTKLGRGFSKLHSLTDLTFLSKMRNLDNKTFSNLVDLPITTLRIWSGWLEEIESHTFANFPELKVLDLSFNPRLGFYSAAEAWPGLEFTQIETLIFNHSTAYNSDIITMNETFLVDLNKTNITSIALNANTIITMKGVFSQYLPYLQNHEFSYNRLTQVAQVIADIVRMEHLVHLDASQQSIRHNRTEKEILAGIGMSQALQIVQILDEDLNINFTNVLVELVDDEPRLESYIQSGDSRIISDLVSEDPDRRYFPECIFIGACLPLAVPATTETVNLAASLSVSVHTLPFIVIFNTINLKYLDYSYNGLVDLSFPMILANRSNHNVTFNLRGNEIRYLCDYFSWKYTAFGDVTEVMLLGKNNLGGQLSTNGTEIMAGMQYMKHLDISENRVKFLPQTAFEPLPLLEVLDLSMNSLRQITFDLSCLTHLKLLDLSGNLLSYIDKTATSQLDVIAKARKSEGTVLELKLLENPFVCSCGSLDFLIWMDHANKSDSGLQIIEFDALLCEYDGNITSFEDLGSVVKKLNRQCNITNILLITFIPSAFIALVVALSVLGWRHKFDIKFWFLNIVIKRKTAQAREDEKKQQYLYDAFVAYCGPKGTMLWVKDQLIPNMEQCGDTSKKLLIHDRDFDLGNPITENIHQGIHQSRKIILIIDKPFLTSEWCKYETHVSHHESIDRGRDVIIAVLLEPASVLLADAYMYHTLKGLLKKRTYIEWPRNAMHQEEFWQRLHKAVQDPIMRPVQCVCGRALDRLMSTEMGDDPKAMIDIVGTSTSSADLVTTQEKQPNNPN